MIEKQQQQHPELASLKATTRLIVLIHGLGSDGHDLITLAPYMQDALPNYHFFSPHGIEAYDMAPFGRQWFSLQDRNPQVVLKLIAESAPKLIQIIQDKQAILGLTNQDTVLVGFSQGTMIGSYITALEKKPFNCFVGFSGRITYPNIRTNNITPHCLIHGSDDSVICADELQKGGHYLSSQQVPHEAHELDNLAHSIDARGIRIAMEFIKKYMHRT